MIDLEQFPKTRAVMERMMQDDAFKRAVGNAAAREALSRAVSDMPPPRAVQVAEAALSVARDQVAATIAVGALGTSATVNQCIELMREVRERLYPGR